jgi:hypothetical protein
MRGDVLNNIVRNFSKQPVKDSALDLLGRATDLRWGTVKMVQSSLHRVETRGSKGEEPVTLGRQFAASRLSRALEAYFPDLVAKIQRQAAILARVAQFGVIYAERIAEIALRHSFRQQTYAEYWRRTQDTDAKERVTKARDRGRDRGRSL